MRLARNFVAGLTNSVWTMTVTLVTVPLYVYYLGVEAYGLIGFFIFSQGILQLLDMGLAPTINREVARCKSQGKLTAAAELLRVLAVIYWVVAALILICFYFAAPYLASSWLNAEGLSNEAIISSAMLIGVVIACRWPLGLYQGALIGAERMVAASSIGMVMTTVSGVGALVILAFISPTIQAYFIWQAVVGLAHSIVVCVAAWNAIGRQGRKGFNWQRLREVWKFSAGMGFVTLTAIVLLQLDKAILTRMLTLEAFGQYMLAVLISSGLYILTRPLFNVIYPRMSALVATEQTEKLVEFYTLGTRLLCTALFPIAVAIAIFSEAAVHAWTQDANIAYHIAPILSLLLIGTALNGTMHFPFALQLSYGLTRLPILINCILISVFLPLTIVLTIRYGAVGGAASWAIVNCMYLLLGTWLTHRMILKEQGIVWLIRDVLWPLLVSVLVVAGGGLLFQNAGYGGIPNLFFAVVLAIVAFLINMALTQNVVHRLRKMLA